MNLNSPTIQTDSYPPAGFWIRLLANIIDSLVMIPVIFAACSVLGFPTLIDLLSAQPGDAVPGVWNSTIVGVVIGVLIFGTLESSKWQASFGKKILGLRVTDLDGARISFLRAAGRYIPKLVIMTVFPLAMVVVGFSSYKRGIHDFMAGTMVYNTSLEPITWTKPASLISQPEATNNTTSKTNNAIFRDK